MIPKHAAFFWAGEILPWLRYMTLYSFRKLNPDWKMTLYRGHSGDDRSEWKQYAEQRQTHQRLEGDDYWPEVSRLNVEIEIWNPTPPNPAINVRSMPPAMQSDIACWQFLAEHGGLWVDMDVLTIRPMSEFPGGLESFDAGLFLVEGRYVTIGYLLAAPRTRFFVDVHRESWNFDPSKYQSAGAEAVYRVLGLELNAPLPSKIMRRLIRSVQGKYRGRKVEFMLQRRYPELNYRILPNAIAYPWEYWEMHNLFARQEPIPEQTIALHWFGGVPFVQWFATKMRPDNLDFFSSTIATEARRILAIERDQQ